MVLRLIVDALVGVDALPLWLLFESNRAIQSTGAGTRVGHACSTTEVALLASRCDKCGPCGGPGVVVPLLPAYPARIVNNSLHVSTAIRFVPKRVVGNGKARKVAPSLI